MEISTGKRQWGRVQEKPGRSSKRVLPGELQRAHLILLAMMCDDTEGFQPGKSWSPGPLLGVSHAASVRLTPPYSDSSLLTWSKAYGQQHSYQAEYSKGSETMC